MPFKNTGPILFIEDGDEDFEMMQQALRHHGVDNAVLRCSDGEEAFAFLGGTRATFEQRPCLVLLDLNLPGADGRQLLLELRGRPGLHNVPIIVLSTSSNPRDIALCYARGANCYAIKPVGLDQLEVLMGRVAHFWLDSVELPPG